MKYFLSDASGLLCQTGIEALKGRKTIMVAIP